MNIEFGRSAGSWQGWRGCRPKGIIRNSKSQIRNSKQVSNPKAENPRRTVPQDRNSDSAPFAALALPAGIRLVFGICLIFDI
jgi:hypothetical protein